MKGEVPMTDRSITELFFDRDEEALAVCVKQYGRMLRALAVRIIGPNAADEAVNDAYLAAWNSIPPQKPQSMLSYLSMLTRRCAIDILKHDNRKKRGGDVFMLSLEELGECIPADSAEAEFDGALLKESVNGFLGALSEKTRVVFMQRYFWSMSCSEIAELNGMKTSAVKMQLARTRERLRRHLEEEGFTV